MKWTMAILAFGVAMAFFDAFYIMPNFSPNTDGQSFCSTNNTSGLFMVIVSFIRFVLGIPLILYGLASDSLVFGSSAFGSAASSAFVMYVLLVPYLVSLCFFIPSEDGVPPGYRVFQFFIARSGARHIDADHFDPTAFDRATRDERTDRYQSQMEAEELAAAAERAREAAAKTNKRTEKQMEAEEERIRAAEDAMRAAEEKFRAQARARASEKHRPR